MEESQKQGNEEEEDSTSKTSSKKPKATPKHLNALRLYKKIQNKLKAVRKRNERLYRNNKKKSKDLETI